MEQIRGKHQYARMELEEVFKNLETREMGLSKAEAQERLTLLGPNRIIEGKRKSILRIFLAQFGDFMIWVLLVAGGVSGLLGEWVDAGIILFVVFINALLGTIQESKAEAALEALKDMSTPSAQVLRDGVMMKISSQDLVPGDLVFLNAGDSVPADLRLVMSASMKIDESALTGESVPTEKNLARIVEMVPLGDRHNMAYMNTSVTYGRGKGFVVGTGMNTEIGSIAEALQETKSETTPLQQKLNQISNTISIGVLVIAFLIFGIGLLTGQNVFEMFLLGISLAVAAIPEGMVAVITIVLAIGMSKMAKEGAIIRKLPAVETLGSTQVICSDKTGTLTQNAMTVQALYSKNEVLLMEGMFHCNDSLLDEKNRVSGDPTESSLLVYLLKENRISLEEIANRGRVGEIPFDSERKKSTVVVSLEDGRFRVFVKGALDGMLQGFKLTEEARDEVMAQNQEMAKKAIRVLAFGYKDLMKYDGSADLSLEEDLEYLGLVGMIDPPRAEAKEAIAVCRRASIIPVMITGDHIATAVAIAEDLGILEDGRHAITGQDLGALSDQEFEMEIEKIGVYARVAPEDKTRIVRMWQKKGLIVAMTGDGVNDAPALKAANIGVGMGITGTEVSKGASDMVLTDDNFATIVSAVREGRRIFDNIQKTVSFLLSSNVGEVIAVLTATILGWHFLSPVHILWINLVTDTFPALALGVEPGEKGSMDRPPRDSRKPFFTARQWRSVAILGLMEAILALLAYALGRFYFGSPLVGTTMAFITLSVAQLFGALGFQSLRDSIFRTRLREHPMLWLGFVGSLVLQLVVVLFPPLRGLFGLASLSPLAWVFVSLLSFSMLLLVELYKVVVKVLLKGN